MSRPSSRGGEPPGETPFGPRDRELLQARAAGLYEAAVVHSGLRADDPTLAEDSAERPAFDLLQELGLLAFESASDRWMPRDPAESQARVVTPLGQRATELLTESSEWAHTFAGLSQTWRKAPVPATGAFTHLEGVAEITRFLEAALHDATEDVLTAQPQTDRAPLPRLMAAAEAELSALGRGVRIRTLYQHSARRHSETHKYVRAVTLAGGEIRTLDEFFNRLIVFDRSVAVIATSENHRSATVIREPSVVAYLIDVFERAWERARPFGNKETETMRDIASEQRLMTIRMLVGGYSDPASSKRLGVSPRTYAGYVADLKTEYDAETRFQLGYVMGQRGVTGDESTASDRQEGR